MESVDRVLGAISLVEEARGVPLSASCVVHRGELLELLDGARNAFPQDFAIAQQIIDARDQILEEAQVSADALIAHGLLANLPSLALLSCLLARPVSLWFCTSFIKF